MRELPPSDKPGAPLAEPAPPSFAALAAAQRFPSTLCLPHETCMNFMRVRPRLSHCYQLPGEPHGFYGADSTAVSPSLREPGRALAAAASRTPPCPR